MMERLNELRAMQNTVGIGIGEHIEMIELFEEEIDRLQAIITDAIDQLHGLPQSRLDGDGGLAAATWRDNQRSVKRCEEMGDTLEQLQNKLAAAQAHRETDNKESREEIKRLQIENQSLRDVFERTQKPHDQLCLDLAILTNELKAMRGTKAAAEAAGGE